jgi:hypothetical protein
MRALLIKGMNFSLTQRRGSAVLGVSPMSSKVAANRSQFSQ